MITILGGTGKVGGKTAEIILEKGSKLRLIARHQDTLAHYAKEGAEIMVGDAKDPEFLSSAFQNSDVVMTMIPGDWQSNNFGKHQDEISYSIITAIKNTGVKKIVFISSVGGHTEEKTGVVAGLARHEKLLNQLSNVDVVILRPTYFMENFFGNIPLIKSMNINGGVLSPDIAFPIIATVDIANVASQYLLNPNFKGISIRALLGPKNYTMREATTILGSAIGKPDLQYIQFKPVDVISSMIGMGISQDVATNMVTLMSSMNEGLFNNEERNELSTTPTTLEEFSSTFAYVYNKQ